MLSTYSLSCLAAIIAASLHKLAMSAPLNPGVNVDNLLANYFNNNLMYTSSKLFSLLNLIDYK
jgi:hypothetical protein